MKIYSWNMLFHNKELGRAFEFISCADFDVFCLQEVPENMLGQLKTLPCNIAYRIDAEKIPTSPETVPIYIVTLSKNPITTQGDIPFPDYGHLFPLRSRIMIYLLQWLHFSKIRNRGGMYTDISFEGKSIRVFNLHLILARPAWRLAEFEKAMLDHDPKRPTIVCGDFNILEKPHITPLNWLFGGHLTDTFFYNRERTNIEKRFFAHELKNPLSGSNTHPLSRSQLDHILVSHSFETQKATVLPDRIGSDHHPIQVTVA